MNLTPAVANWRDAGSWLTALGHRVYVRVAGAADAPECVVVLHGFPSSSQDFHKVLPGLTAKRRVVLFDFLGFGLSDKPAEFGYSLFEQADLTLLVLRELGVSRCHLWAHDMGTSVACELLARRELSLLPFEVASLTLMNGSVHIELASLTVSQRLLLSPVGPAFSRLGSRSVFAAQLRRISGELSETDIDDMWSQLCHKQGKQRLPQTIQYVRERARFHQRWIGALQRLSDLPSLILWGDRDSVAIPKIAETLAGEIPGAELRWLAGLGHYPQLEDPEATLEELLAFLDSV